VTVLERAAYAGAGVDVGAGERAVELLRARLGGTGDLLGGLGGFASAVPLPGMREPVIVTATDGVGTKTELARRLGRFDTIGTDLVAMCVDDIVCHGARPWLFLDYLAVGRLEPARVAAIVGGIADACAAVGATLVGGETAEHPGVMEPDAFDLAGFCIGLVERDELIDGSQGQAGDAVIGLPSSGLHANGFSLVRRVLEQHGLDLEAPFDEVVASHLGRDGLPLVDEASSSLGDVLLTPTSLYAAGLLAADGDVAHPGRRGIVGMAHVTGGGLAGNLPRAVGPDLGIEVDPGTWPVPVAIQLVATLASLSDAEMRATFNAGIGMALVVRRDRADEVATWAGQALGGRVIGRVVPVAETGPTRYREIP
jgi:phosphoribosylformylglycinamidine cyclo-ligase